MQEKQNGHPTLHTLKNMLFRLQDKVSQLSDMRGSRAECSGASPTSAVMDDGKLTTSMRMSPVRFTPSDTENLTQSKEEESGSPTGERKENNDASERTVVSS